MIKLYSEVLVSDLKKAKNWSAVAAVLLLFARFRKNNFHLTKKSCEKRTCTRDWFGRLIVVAHIVMASIVIAYVIMAYIIMAYVVMAI